MLHSLKTRGRVMLCDRWGLGLLSLKVHILDAKKARIFSLIKFKWDVLFLLNVLGITCIVKGNRKSSWSCLLPLIVRIWRAVEVERSQHGLAASIVELQTKVREDFTIAENALTRAFSWLKVPTSNVTFKTLFRHYTEQPLTHRKLGCQEKGHAGQALWLT